MFSTNDVNRTPVPSKFQSSFLPKQEVVFQTNKLSHSAHSNYIAVIESEEVYHSDSDSESDEPPFERLYNDRQIYSKPTLGQVSGQAQAQSVAPPTPDPFSLGKDPIKTFYIGSITVVGLYILYKILNKR
jgi:hypothetical protein